MQKWDIEIYMYENKNFKSAKKHKNVSKLFEQ